MLNLRLNRYDSNYCVKQVRQTKPNIIGGDVVIAFMLDDQDFEVYLPLSEGDLLLNYIEIAVDVMTQITRMDNLVQKFNADEYQRTGIASENFYFFLSYVAITENNVKFGYYGELVNTEWEAIFKKSEIEWVAVNFDTNA